MFRSSLWVSIDRDFVHSLMIIDDRISGGAEQFMFHQASKFLDVNTSIR